MTITITKRYVKFLQTVNGNTTSTHYLSKNVALENDSLISIPLEKLKEFHDNLIYSGFNEDEALMITAKVAANARTTN